MELTVRRCLRCLAVAALLAGCGDRPETAPEQAGGGDAEGGGEWRSAFVEANGVRIHYWRTGGAGKPVIVMAHGVTDSALCWASFARRLENDYDIIMYDARGHGLSDKPAGSYSIETQAADLVALVAALGLDRPTLMGHSMGGSTVTRAASDHPDLARAVILVDPAGMLAPPGFSAERWKEFAAKWDAQIEADKAAGKAKLIELARSTRHPGWTREDYENWAEAKLQVTSRIISALGDLGDFRAQFTKITAPALILKADADDVEREEHQAVAALLPHGRLVHVAGAGHVVHLDEPEATEREVRAFLAGVR
jgi:pimeloyl-ACP methyl ester carboxylesterase